MPLTTTPRALACAGSRARMRALGLDGWYAHDRRV